MNQQNANGLNQLGYQQSAANNLSGLLQEHPAASALNDSARLFMANAARKPSSFPLRQRGDAERLRKPVKIRR